LTPIEASSGKVTRQRLNRGGDRQANSALWRIVRVRMVSEPGTRAYVVRRTEEGRSKLEIIRILKRYVAREVYHYLPAPRPPERRVWPWMCLTPAWVVLGNDLPIRRSRATISVDAWPHRSLPSTSSDPSLVCRHHAQPTLDNR
jgi:hypothetical protein